jgi:hypothetical protein
MKQRHTDLLLELLDLHANRGLRPIQLFRRLPKALIVGNSDKDMKKFEVDVRHLRGSRRRKHKSQNVHNLSDNLIRLIIRRCL